MAVQQESAIKGKKLSFHLSSLCLGVSLFAAATTGFLTISSQVQASQAVKRPTVATVKSMTNGDISCYVTLIDQQGKKYNQIPADFDICVKEKTFLNKKVRLTYGEAKVNDCQSAEPCGMSRI